MDIDTGGGYSSGAGVGKYVADSAKRAKLAEIDKQKNTVATKYDVAMVTRAIKKWRSENIEKKCVDMDSVVTNNISVRGIVSATQGTTGGTSLTAGYVATPGSFVLLNGCDQSSNANSRIGNIVSLKSIQVRWSMTVDQSTNATTPPVNARVIILYDNQTNGAFPTWVSSTANASDVMNIPTYDGTTEKPFAVTSMRSNVNVKRFKTFYDKAFVLNACAGGPNAICDNWYKNLTGYKTYWKNTGSTAKIADIDSGSIIIGAVSDVLAASSAFIPVVFEFTSRTRFIDD